MKCQNIETVLSEIERLQDDSIATALVVPLDILQYMNFRTKVSFKQLELLNIKDSLMMEYKLLNRELTDENNSLKEIIEDLRVVEKPVVDLPKFNDTLYNQNVDLKLENSNLKKQRNRTRLFGVFSTLGVGLIFYALK